MASDASSRTSISAKNAIKNRRDMADTLLYPYGSHTPRADARRAAVQKLYSRRVPGSQRKRRVRQGYGPGKQPTRNCSPSSGEKSRITGGFSSVDTGNRATPRTTAAWWGIRPPRTPAESLARCRGMPSEIREVRLLPICIQGQAVCLAKDLCATDSRRFKPEGINGPVHGL